MTGIIIGILEDACGFGQIVAGLAFSQRAIPIWSYALMVWAL
jgi:hypothetical protein